ncbi:MAG: hypothetical protein HY673_00725 [Chloroflexi bacterium]|nr:hypothetical protein [Chloroflexota bacterium]
MINAQGSVFHHQGHKGTVRTGLVPVVSWPITRDFDTRSGPRVRSVPRVRKADKADKGCRYGRPASSAAKPPLSVVVPTGRDARRTGWRMLRIPPATAAVFVLALLLSFPVGGGAFAGTHSTGSASPPICVLAGHWHGSDAAAGGFQADTAPAISCPGAALISCGAASSPASPAYGEAAAVIPDAPSALYPQYSGGASGMPAGNKLLSVSLSPPRKPPRG